MNDYVFKTMMQHRHGAVVADFRAARNSQQVWQGIFLKLRHRLRSFCHRVKTTLEKTRYLNVDEGRCM